MAPKNAPDGCAAIEDSRSEELLVLHRVGARRQHVANRSGTSDPERFNHRCHARNMRTRHAGSIKGTEDLAFVATAIAHRLLRDTHTRRRDGNLRTAR